MTCSKEPWASILKKGSYVDNSTVNLYANKPVSSLPHKVEPTKQTVSSAHIQHLAISHQTVIDDFHLAFINHPLPCLHRTCQDREFGLGKACLEPLLLDMERLEK